MSLHFFSRWALRLVEAAQTPEHVTDPIDHPAIAAMDLRTIADLPLSQPRPRAEAPRAEGAATRQLSRSAAA